MNALPCSGRPGAALRAPVTHHTPVTSMARPGLVGRAAAVRAGTVEC
ncbi:hypothetical protein [Nonomuraea monospora]